MASGYLEAMWRPALLHVHYWLQYRAVIAYAVTVQSQVILKLMSDERPRWSLSSANKIGQQTSVVCHAKIGRICLLLKSSDFIVQLEHVLFSTRKSPNLYAVTRRNTLTS